MNGVTTISRRTLLTLASASPLIVSGVGAGTARAAAPAPWKQLAAQLHGRLFLPSTPGYRAAAQLFDPVFDTRRPAAVVKVASAQDVATSLRFAQVHGVHVTARSGGHSYVGASAANNALVLDLRALAGVTYDAATKRAAIGAGARLYDVHVGLAARGRAIATGTCPTVGVSGLTSGGGLGVSSRQYGLTSDALVWADVMLPDGRSITASTTSNPDVFWALRGGGGGSVGIVTRWVFATHAATSRGSFVLDVPAAHPERVLQGWGAWIASAPRSQWANAHVTRTSGGVSIRFVGITNVGDEHSAAAALLRACGVSATRAVYGQRSHLDTVRFLGGGTTSPRTAFTAGSDVLRALDARSAAAVVTAVRHASAGCVAILDPLTGAVRDVAAGATAFPWRSHLASVQWYTGSTNAAARAWVAQAHRDLAGVSSGRYVNYVEAGTGIGLYLGSNTARYDDVRRRRDPHSTLVTSMG